MQQSTYRPSFLVAWLGAGHMPVKWVALLMALPTLTYVALVWWHILPFPVWDDYELLLEPLARWQQSAREGLKALWMQFYEHRLPVGRTLALLSYQATGRPPFWAWIALPNLFFALGVWALAVHSYRRYGAPMWAVAAFAAFVFNLSSYEVAWWATTCLYFFPIYLFAGLSAYFAFEAGSVYPTGSSPRIIPALLTAILCAGSGANGMLIFGALGITCVLRQAWHDPGQRRLLIAMAVAGLVWILVYAIGYQRPSHQQPVFQSLWQQPLRFLWFWVLLSGNAFMWGEQVAAAWGLLSLGVLLWLLSRKPWQRHPTLFALLAFMWLTLVVVAAGRFTAPYSLALVSRYCSFSSVYSGLLVLLAGCYMRQTWQWPLALLLLAGCGAGYARSLLIRVPEQRTRYLFQQQQWQRVKEGRLSLFHYGSLFDQTDTCKSWLRRYDSLGIFRFSFVPERQIFEQLPFASQPVVSWQRGEVLTMPHETAYRIYLKLPPPPADTLGWWAAWEEKDNRGGIRSFTMMRHRKDLGDSLYQCFEVGIQRWWYTRPAAAAELWITNEREKWVLPVSFNRLQWHSLPE